MKQLAPTGQLVPVNDKLVYQAPNGDRLLLEGDRRLDQLAMLLPQVQAGLVVGQQAQLVKQAYEEVLTQASSQYHQLATLTVKQQHETIQGLVGVLNKLADPVDAPTPQTIVRTEYRSENDALGTLIGCAVIVVLMAITALSINLIARTIEGSIHRPVQVQSIER